MKLSKLIAKVYKDFYFDKETKHWVITGGRSSSKGDAAYTKAITELLTNPGRVIVYVPIQSTIRDGVMEQVQKVADRMGVEYRAIITASRIIFNEGSENESDIVFKGLAMDNAKKKAEAFKGIDSSKPIHMVIFDELASLDDDSRLNTIVETVSRNARQIVYVWNPPRNKNHWLFEFREHMKDEPDTKVLHTTVYDIPAEWVQDSLANAERIKRLDYEKWQHAYMGLATGLDDVAYPVDVQTLIVTPEEINKKIQYFDVFIDNGQKDATVFCLYAFTYDKKVVLLDTFYHSGRATGQVLPDSTYVEKYIEWERRNLGSLRPRRRYCDSISFRAECEKQGFDMNHMTNKRRVEQYNLSRELVLNGQFFILDNPNNAIFMAQFENAELEFKKDVYGFEKPCIAKVDNTSVSEKRQIHALDTFLYCSLINYLELKEDYE